MRRLGAYLAGRAHGARETIWAHIGAATLLPAFRHVLAAWIADDLRADPGTYFDDIMDEIAGTIGREEQPDHRESGDLVVATKLAPAAIARLIQAAEQHTP